MMSGILVKGLVLLVSGLVFGVGEFAAYSALDELKKKKAIKKNNSESKKEDIVDSNLKTQEA